MAKEFEGELNCLGRNIAIYKNFSDPLTKRVKRIDKYEKEITKIISYRLQSIYSARLIAIIKSC